MKKCLMILGMLVCLTAVAGVYAITDPLMVTTDLTSLQRAPGSEVVARIEFVLDDFTEATFNVHIDGIIFSSASGNDLVFDFEDGTPQGFSGDPFLPSIVASTLGNGLYMLEFTDDPSPFGAITTLVFNAVTLPHDVIALSFLFEIEQFGDVLFDAVNFQVFFLDPAYNSSNYWGNPEAALLPDTPIIYGYNVWEDSSVYNPEFTDVNGLVVIPEPVSMLSLLLGIAGIARYRKRLNG